MTVAVIGLGQFGASLARNLARFGIDVIAIDKNMNIIDSIKDSVSDAVCISSTDEKALIAAGVLDADVAVVAIGEDVQASILTTAILRRLGIMLVYSRATSSLQEEILKEVGAREVFFIEEEMATELAKKLISQTTLDTFPIGETHLLVEVPPFDEFLGKPIEEIAFEESYRVTLIAVKKKKRTIDRKGKTIVQEAIVERPVKNFIINQDDSLYLFGTKEQLKPFIK